MKGVIKNFKRGRRTVTMNQMIIYPEELNGKEEATKLVEKTVVWKTPAGNEIKGKVRSAHGTKGAIRVLFERGMPGQAIGTPVEIQ